jgi:hypothetical protein
MERKTIRPGVLTRWLPGPHRVVCQCCGRLIKAKRGLVAHHGYTKFKNRWRSASCMGARYEPFETHRNRLAYLLTVLERELKAYERLLYNANVARRGLSPDYECRFEWTVRRHLIGAERRNVEEVQFSAMLSQANFLAFYKTHEGKCNRQGMRTFVDMIERDQRHYASEIRQLVLTIAHQTKRYNNWEPIK